jgi:hypothetical protein
VLLDGYANALREPEAAAAVLKLAGAPYAGHNNPER